MANYAQGTYNTRIPSRNGMIEFLRFLFAVMIVLFHGQETWAIPVLFSHFSLFFRGAIGVEFFFIVSGFLMARSASREPFTNSDDLGEETSRFVWKKYTSIFPYHFYAFILSFIVLIVLNHYSIGKIIKTVFLSLPNLFLIEMTGTYTINVNGYEWYISAMLLTMLMIYPILKRFYKLFVNVIAPLLVLFILGWLSHKYGTLTYISLWTGFVYKGLLRAIAEISLGCISYNVFQKIKSYKYDRIGIIVLTLLELSGYFFTIAYSCTRKTEQYYFILVFLLALSIAITFSELTFTTSLFNKPIFNFLGKFSLPLYLNQLYTEQIVSHFYGHSSNPTKIIIYFVLTIIASIISMVVVDFIKRKFNNRRILRNLNSEEDNTMHHVPRDLKKSLPLKS